MVSRQLDFLHSDSGLPERMFTRPQWKLQDFFRSRLKVQECHVHHVLSSHSAQLRNRRRKIRFHWTVEGIAKNWVSFRWPESYPD